MACEYIKAGQHNYQAFILLQFFLDDFCDFIQRLTSIAIQSGQAALRHVGTSPTFAADAGDEVTRFKSALDEIFGSHFLRLLEVKVSSNKTSILRLIKVDAITKASLTSEILLSFFLFDTLKKR